jgi:dTDP-4-dehydrorhamnose 3,5-epimerase
MGLPLAGLKRVERQNVDDARGFLSRLFCSDELADAGWLKPVKQINQTVTIRRGAVRGMHFQRPPHAEMKLVTCLRGAIWDVAVDLRKGSPTFLRWHAEELSADNRRALLVPEGFAHGFQTLSDNCELLYVHSAPYRAEAEDGVSPSDSALAISWPLAISERSDRDVRHSPIKPDFEGLAI